MDTHNPRAWHDSWSRVDETEDPEFFIRFLDSSRKSQARLAYLAPARFFAHLALRPTDRVLEVGCGTGDFVHAMAQMLCEGGFVIGVDKSRAMAAEARRRGAGPGAPVGFCVTDAQELGISAASFDVCTATAVLQHLPDPARALQEMARVARPGGRVVVTETDWESQIIDSSDRDTTRAIVSTFTDSLKSGWVARSLPALFHEAGLKDVSVTVSTTVQGDFEGVMSGWLRGAVWAARDSGVITAEAAEAWLDEQSRRAAQGRFFYANTAVRVSGTR